MVDNPSQYSVPIPGKSGENMALQIEPREVIAEISMFLQGITLDKDGEPEKSFKPLVNDNGVAAIVTMLRAHLNPAVVLANLTEDEIRQISKEVRMAMIRLIHCHHDDYKMDIANWDILLQLVDHSVFCFMSRTKNNGERQYHSTVQRYITSIKEALFDRSPKEKADWPTIGRGQAAQ